MIMSTLRDTQLDDNYYYLAENCYSPTDEECLLFDSFEDGLWWVDSEDDSNLPEDGQMIDLHEIPLSVQKLPGKIPGVWDYIPNFIQCNDGRVLFGPLTMDGVAGFWATNIRHSMWALIYFHDNRHIYNCAEYPWRVPTGSVLILHPSGIFVDSEEAGTINIRRLMVPAMINSDPPSPLLTDTDQLITTTADSSTDVSISPLPCVPVFDLTPTDAHTDTHTDTVVRDDFSPTPSSSVDDEDVFYSPSEELPLISADEQSPNASVPLGGGTPCFTDTSRHREGVVPTEEPSEETACAPREGMSIETIPLTGKLSSSSSEENWVNAAEFVPRNSPMTSPSCTPPPPPIIYPSSTAASIPAVWSVVTDSLSSSSCDDNNSSSSRGQGSGCASACHPDGDVLYRTQSEQGCRKWVINDTPRTTVSRTRSNLDLNPASPPFIPRRLVPTSKPQPQKVVTTTAPTTAGVGGIYTLGADLWSQVIAGVNRTRDYEEGYGVNFISPHKPRVSTSCGGVRMARVKQGRTFPRRELSLDQCSTPKSILKKSAPGYHPLNIATTNNNGRVHFSHL